LPSEAWKRTVSPLTEKESGSSRIRTKERGLKAGESSHRQKGVPSPGNSGVRSERRLGGANGREGAKGTEVEKEYPANKLTRRKGEKLKREPGEETVEVTDTEKLG